MTKKKRIRFKANTKFERLFEPSALSLIAQDNELKEKWCLVKHHEDGLLD